MPDYNFSFSGVKTAVMYFLRDQEKLDPGFTERNIKDICASVQHTIIQMLLNKLKKAAKELNIKHIGIAGGVSANSGLRQALQEAGDKNGWQVYIPKFEYCTDNAAMIAITAYYKSLKGEFAGLLCYTHSTCFLVMSNSYFQFKQFRIDQGDTAMKVSTDACIQGACTPILPGVKKVLDIGCGTGLLSLMLAQRSAEINIDAIELDEAAANQARANVAASPWADRINVMQADARVFRPTHPYDLIICNPPFFNNSLIGDNAARNRARHSLTLTQQDLFALAKAYLSPAGYIFIMLPLPEHNVWNDMLLNEHWHPINWVAIKDNANARVKRIVSSWARKQSGSHSQDLWHQK